jgi:hypothetical protein
MPRYAPATSPEALQALMIAHIQSKPDFEEDMEPDFTKPLRAIESALMSGPDYGLFTKVYEDWAKIDFDLENVLITDGAAMPLRGFQTAPNGFTFLGLMCGGDWETPLLAIVYHDGKAFRGYVPTKGNCFVASTKQAFGTAESADAAAFLAKTFPTHPDIQGKSVAEVEAGLDNLDLFAITLDKQALLDDIMGRITLRG